MRLVNCTISRVVSGGRLQTLIREGATIAVVSSTGLLSASMGVMTAMSFLQTPSNYTTLRLRMGGNA